MKRLLLILGLLVGISQAQTTTAITGTIKDLSQALVTSGKVTFTLQPSRDTTISGLARFSPAQVVCLINASGLIKAQDGTSVCTLTMNTALNPPGTYYRVDYWPFNVKIASFTFYAVLSTYDWSTVVPTPTTSPAQNFVDIFSNQTIGGAKTWSGAQTFNGAANFAAGLSSTTGSFVNSGVFSNSQQNLYLQSLLGGCNPTSQWNSVFNLPNHATEASTYCAVIPSGASVFQVNSVGAYVENQNGPTTAGVAVFGMATASTTVDGRVWAANFLATDVAGVKSQSLYSQENDCNILTGNTTSVCHGLLITGFWKAQPTISMGIEIGPIQQGTGCTTCVWPYGIRFDQGATNAPGTSNAAVYFFPVTSGSSQPSQGMTFLGSSSGGTQDMTATQNLDSLGNLAFVTTAANSGILLNSKQVTRTIGSGTSTSNGTAIGAGTSQAQPAITVTGALTSDTATCSLNAAPPATWQTGIQFLPGVVTANTVTPWLSNGTAGSITPVATAIRCTVTR